jgi:DNA replication protein DnaC
MAGRSIGRGGYGFVTKAANAILLEPPGLGKAHLAIGLGVKATQAGFSVLFDTASNWITRLAGRPHRCEPAGQRHCAAFEAVRTALASTDEVAQLYP